jgi:DNA-binding CsgD family transcriptional regulator
MSNPVNLSIPANAEAKKLLLAGKNAAQVADILNLSRQHVRRIANQIKKDCLH